MQWSFESFGLLVQDKKVQNRFSTWLLGFSIRMILAIFYLQVTLIFPIKFQINWPFCSEDVQNMFSTWQPDSIFDQNKFSYFWSTSHSGTSYQVSSQLAFGFRRRSAKITKMAAMVAILDFSYFWSTSHPVASYQVSRQLAFRFRRRSKQ